MTKPFCQVFVTDEYEKFKAIEGNRRLNQLHLKRLRESIKSHGVLVMPIVVNENMEVIDGHHRLRAIMDAEGLIYYIVVNGYSLNEVHILNENTKNWNAEDFMHSYCDLGKAEYVKYRTFRNAYGLDHNVCMGLLSGSTTGKTVQELFKSGEFKVKNYAKACEIAENLLLIEPLYSGWKRWTFVLALLGAMKKPGFELSEFVAKLKLQSTRLVDCVNVEQYRDLIEDIYNHKRRREDKVNLRY